MATEALTEEQKMQLVPGIVFVDGPAGRRARLAGTGPDVWEVINAWRFCNGRMAELKDYFTWLPEEALCTAVRYYEHFPIEIDAFIADNDRIAEDLKRCGAVYPPYSSRK